MFCQTCGNAIIGNIKYCNRCGANVSGTIEKTEQPVVMMPPSKPTGIVVTLSIVTGLIVLSGLGMMIPLLIALLKSGVEVPAITAMAFMFLGTIFGISWLMIRQISRALDVYLHGNIGRNNQQLQDVRQPQPAQLFNRTTGQIEAPREPFISVTENTTRTLDTILKERNG